MRKPELPVALKRVNDINLERSTILCKLSKDACLVFGSDYN